MIHACTLVGAVAAQQGRRLSQTDGSPDDSSATPAAAPSDDGSVDVTGQFPFLEGPGGASAGRRLSQTDGSPDDSSATPAAAPSDDGSVDVTGPVPIP